MVDGTEMVALLRLGIAKISNAWSWNLARRLCSQFCSRIMLKHLYKYIFIHFNLSVFWTCGFLLTPMSDSSLDDFR